MTAGQVAADVNAVKSTGDAILAAIEGADPALDVPAESAGAVLDLVAELFNAAATAWSNASGQPITKETIAALIIPDTPLPDPPTP